MIRREDIGTREQIVCIVLQIHEAQHLPGVTPAGSEREYELQLLPDAGGDILGWFTEDKLLEVPKAET